MGEWKDGRIGSGLRYEAPFEPSQSCFSQRHHAMFVSPMCNLTAPSVAMVASSFKTSCTGRLEAGLR